MTNLLPKVWNSSLALSVICLTIFPPGKGFAGDAFAPAPQPTLDQAHCDALGDGFFAVAGSSACIKISGYVSAGTEFSIAGAKGASSGPFAPRSGVGPDSHPRTRMKPDASVARLPSLVVNGAQTSSW